MLSVSMGLYKSAWFRHFPAGLKSVPLPLRRCWCQIPRLIRG